MTDSVVYRS